MMSCRRLTAALSAVATPILVLAGLAEPNAASAQAWPAKQPIRILSPYAPGGTTDVLARMLGAKLQEKLGQTVIVENRAGAGGNIGTDAIAKAAPDGYSLLLAASGPIVIAPSLFPKLTYSPMKDLSFISPIASASFVILTQPGSGINSLKDLIAQGRQSNKLNFASAGAGTPQHIIGEMFNLRAGTHLQHIPYRGSGPAMTALLGGEVPVSFENPLPAMPHVKSGKIKVLAITAAKRSAIFPDIPTVAELGLAGFDAKPWYGLLGPAQLDPEVIRRLNTAVREILDQTEIKARLFALGAEPMRMSSAEFQSFVARDLEKWTQVVKTSGATAE